MVMTRFILLLFVSLVLLQSMKTTCGLSLATGESKIIRCIERERQALVNLKQGIIDDSGYLASWGSEEDKAECCKWSRIQCSNKTGHVITLDLRSAPALPLRGEISPSLFQLRHLNYLDLSRNAFQLAFNPNFFGSLSKLRYLNLSRAGLDSTFPYQIGNLSSLQYLDLSYNYPLKAENLLWLAHLSSLRYLDMSLVNLSMASNWFQEINLLPKLSDVSLVGCSLSDPVPLQSSPMNYSVSLSILDLSFNQFNISIFYRLSNISTGLFHLTFKFNSFRGQIPDAFWNMNSLTYLDLSWNEFEGEIPKSMGNLCNLQKLDLSINHLNEQLRDTTNTLLANCSANALEFMSLRVNNFSGPIPDFTKFSSLRELHLDRNRLNGSIPESFVYFPNLLLLHLHENQVSGALPYLAKSLKVLNLSRNRLNGTLTPSIGQLPELLYLYVASNHFEGVISEAQLSNFSKLQHLDLSLNSLFCNFSTNWVPYFSLETIRLSGCKLGPLFPGWLQRLESIVQLDISSNEISGVIPNWFWELTPKLRYLNLSYNQISGMLPNSSLIFVDILDLSFNHFEGPLPLFSPNATSVDLSYNMFSGGISSICDTKYLHHLDLSDNLLSGELPDCWKPMILLSVISLANNNFSGKIPPSIGSAFFLQSLHLRNNSLSGEIPSSLQNCGLLKLMDVGENRLSGEIPKWIGERLSLLMILSLGSNEFRGSIPLNLCHLISIQVLDISDNKISGSIPWCFNNFSTMSQKENPGEPISYDFLPGFIENVGYVSSYVENAMVAWKGRQLKFVKVSGLLKVVDFSSNNLTGQIPRQMTSILGLVSLNLSRNCLTGTIPERTGDLNMLESLDFSRNHLSGSIPASLENLNFLQYLDLSNNDLVGKIPSGTQLQSFNASAFAGNPKLCGPPLLKKCTEDETPAKVDGPHKDGNWYELPQFHASVGFGFFAGFWGVCFTLLFKTSWRYAYFRFFDDVKDRFYEMLAELKHKFQI